MSAAKEKNVKVTLVRSTNGALPKHKASVKGLGLRRIRHSVIVADNACNRGMMNKIDYLITVEEV
jgi:large subunit ribosomal protein L30